MAVTLLAQYAAAVGDMDFVHKVEIAVAATGINMKDESAGTVNHANRMALMKAAANSPATYAPLFALGIAAEGVDNTSSDAAIQAMVATIWNEIAGMP